MEYCQLGKTKLVVSRICFGSLTLGPLCADLPLDKGRDLLLAAFDLGINFIDTAEQYYNYQYISAALDMTDQEIIIATKTYADDARGAASALEDARIAFRRNTIDIFLLHEIRSIDDFNRRADAWKILINAKANGAVGVIGISTHSAAVAAWAAEEPSIEIIHPMVNISGVGIIEGNLEQMLAAIRKAKENGKGIYGMKAIGGGALMHQAKEALEWAFDQKDIDAIAIGLKDTAELKTNIGWLEGVDPPEAATVKLLERNMVFDKEPACHRCGKCIDRCPQQALAFGDNGIIWDKSKCVYCGYCINECHWFCISFC